MEGQFLLEIGISGDVAVIFYTSTIRYLKNIGNNQVIKVFEKSVSGTDIDITTAEYQYKIKFSCLCEGIKRFACFSSTLNCLVVKKAGAGCSSEPTFIPV
jgi:hypothetical protein